MEEDVEPKDEDGVDGRGVCGWDGWVGALGAVGASSIFRLVRRAGAFAAVLPTSVLVSRMQLAQQYRGNGHFLSAASSSRRETMVGGALTRASALRVGLGVGGAAIASGSRARPMHSYDRWVGDLDAVGASSIFGWLRGAGAFAAVLPTFVLVSRMQHAQQYRGNGHFLSAASSSRRETMVGGALTRASALRVSLGVGGATIVPGSCARPSHS
jgi:cellobiose-specific phosphotransferase system component IIB